MTTMRDLYEAENYLVCPHTATAVVGVRRLGLPAATTVCLATAHPAKFEEAVGLALTGKALPARPAELDKLFYLHTRSTLLPNALANVQAFVRSKLTKESWFESWQFTVTASALAVAAAAAIAFFAITSASHRSR